MKYLLVSFWFVIFTRKFLFWVYLWQLKEYHIGRFIDHFRTYKGKKLILNFLLAVKIAIFLAFLFFDFSRIYLFHFILALFFIEFLFSIRNLIKKKFRIPVLTRKTSVILSSGISFELLVISFLFGMRVSLNKFIVALLALDILAPLVTTFLVLAFQPLAVALRERVLKAAEKKIESVQEDILVIGIAGSYGKTSTKEFLATILAKKYKVLKTKEHQNSEIGISNCVLDNLEKKHEIFVVEMGAYNRGGIELLAKIVKPKIGIITGINQQHMATFGSQNNIISTKFELIEALPEDGVAILNIDDVNIKKQEIEYYNPKLKNVRFYSIEDKSADIWAENIKIEKEIVFFKVKTKNGESADFQLAALGKHNIHNFLAAVCCAEYLGMSLPEISRAAAEISDQQSGMELKKGIYDLSVIDATYSANPSGVMSHLDYLKIWPGKKILVMPCLIELGKASEDVHRKIGRKIAEVCDLAIITTKDRFKEIKKGSGEQFRGKHPEILFMDGPDEIFKKIRDFAEPGGVILLESRVPSKLIELLIK